MLELRRVDIYSLERYLKKAKSSHGPFGPVAAKLSLLIKHVHVRILKIPHKYHKLKNT